MISRLQGTLAEADVAEVVVDVHGVGYAVSIPMSTFDHLPRLGQEVVLHTYLAVRDDALQLFGFATMDERRLFMLLLTVNGIGPRLALNVLSGMPIAAFCQAIANADLKALSRISGVGKRTAERLVVELKGKVAEIAPAAVLGAQGAVAVTTNRVAQDAVSALETLGFKGELALKAVAQLCNELPAKEQTAENLIRRALQKLNS